MAQSTAHVRPAGNPKEIGAQVLRTALRLARLPDVRPQQRVPWSHDALFREPVYADGQPYDRDGEDDED